MIKMSADNPMTGKRMLVLGLSDGNLMRLREGKPIHVLGVEWGQPVDLMIFWGPTEAAMAEMVKPFIGPETVVRDMQKEPRQ